MTSRGEAEERLKEVVQQREDLYKDYESAIQDCVDAGMSNTQMGAIAGVSEAAIRMYRGRHKIKRA